MSKNTKKMIKLRGKLQYFKREPGLSDKYEVIVAKLDKENTKKAKDAGLAIKVGSEQKNENKHDWGNFIVAYSKFVANPIVDAKKNAIPDDILIGNDTEANVILDVFDYNNKFGKGTTCSATAIQVLDLVKYESNLFDEEEGFETEASDDSEELDDVPFDVEDESNPFED